jgi:hypothetical protein
MARKKIWYDTGYDDARTGLNCDPPMTPGHRSYKDYVAGYGDGEFSLVRDAQRERADLTID